MADYNINAVTRRKVFTGSAGVGPYAFTFEILDDDDLAVYFNATKLTKTTDYSVTINANGTGSVTLVVNVGGNVPQTPIASDAVIVVGARDIERTTDFVTAGDLLASSLNEQLDSLTIFDQQIAEEEKRTLQAPVYDPAHVDEGGTLDMTLPAKAARAGKYLQFNSTTGNPEAGPDSTDVTAIANIATDIATLADIEDGTDATDAIQTVAGVASNVTTVAGIASNVSSVAGNASNINAAVSNASNINTVAGKESEITSVAAKASLLTSDFVADLNTLAVTDVINDINTLATSDIVSDINTLATSDIVSDLNTLATSDIVSDINTLATSDIVTDLNLLATSDFVADLNTMATSTNTTNLGTVAGAVSNVNTVAGISSDVSAVAGISGSDISAVAGKATEIGLLGTADAVSDMNVLGTSDAVSDMNALAAISSDISSLAGALEKTYTVTVASGVFYLDGVSKPTITLFRGNTYIFDQSDSSNAGHPIAFRESDDTSYTTGVTSTGTAGSAGAKTTFNVPSDAPNTLKYYCTVHGNNMGNTITVTDSNISLVASNIANVNLTGGSITNVNNVGGSIANVNTVATNINSVNDFADKYRIGSSDPSSNNDEGDLFYNTTSDTLKIYNGSAWEAGVTAGSGFMPLSGGQLTGNITMSGSQTVDGRDLSVDGAKLDGIEANADVTDATNVAAAGAFMASGGSISGSIDVTGTVTSDGLTVDGDVTLNDGSPNLRLQDSDVSRYVDFLYGTRVATFRNTMASGEDIDVVEPSIVFSFKDDGETRTAVTIDHDGNLNVTGAITGDGSGLTNIPGFPSGTKMLFQQSAAPTGWTKDTTHNDKALRIVSGSVGTGGSTAFSSALATPSLSISVSGSTGSTTITSSSMPSHTHAIDSVGDSAGAYYTGHVWGYRANAQPDYSTFNTGGGGSHNHSLSASASGTAGINVQYVDVIIATKD